jgi:septal ring factor EnvC (AmiA/AmiB activator)
MKMRFAGALLLCGTVAWSLAARANEPPRQSGENRKAASAGDMDLKWNRDFDLLLDMGDVPTVQQRVDTARRKTLEKERASLEARLADLKSRLASVEGSYTSEAVLKEMLRQDVNDMQTVQSNLKRDVEQTQRKINDVDEALKHLRSEKPE